MSAANTPFKLFAGSVDMADPGNAATITADRSPGICNLVSLAAETRTLARPTRLATILLLNLKTNGGNITLTVTGGYNEAGDTSFVFSGAGQIAVFMSAFDGTNFYWRLIAQQGGGNVSARHEIVAAANVILASESGKTFYLDLAGGFQSTLPAPALGLEFEFIVKTAPTTAYTIVAAASATIIKGHVLTNDVNSATDADFGTAGELTLTFVANKAVAGDRIRVKSDGTSWFAACECSVFDAITLS